MRDCGGGEGERACSCNWWRTWVGPGGGRGDFVRGEGGERGLGGAGEEDCGVGVAEGGVEGGEGGGEGGRFWEWTLTLFLREYWKTSEPTYVCELTKGEEEEVEGDGEGVEGGRGVEG